MDYPTFQPVTKTSYKQHTSHRNNFADYNYNYVNIPKTTKLKTNTQNFYSESQKIPETTSNSVNFYDQLRSSQEQSGNSPFFQQNKIIKKKKYHTRNQPHYYAQNYFPSDDEEYLNKIISDFTQDKDLVLIVLTNQIFLNHTHKTNKYDNLEIVQHLTTIIFNNKTQLTHNHTNQIKCIMKSTAMLFTTTQNN